MKKALVVEGGGSRGVFSFGVIDSFIQASFNPFNLHLGVSNGSVVQLWYILNVSNYNLEKMLFSASKKYVNFYNIFRNKSVMNFEKLYEDAESIFPIDFARLQNNLQNKNFFVVISDAHSGHPEYIELSENNYVNEMLASGSLPVLMKNPVIIDGNRKYDGGITDPLPVKKAYEMGARDIVVIRTYEESFVRKTKLENYIAAFFTKQYPEISKALKTNTATYNASLDFINNPPDDCSITQICPPKRLTVRRATTDIKIMKADYEVGLECGKNFLVNRQQTVT
jgi:predicted patatin/cPLA2 family phospholipase